MKLSHFEQSIYDNLPELAFGEDRTDYILRCAQQAEEAGAPSSLVVELAKLKWRQWEIKRLILEIEEGSAEAARKALIMLLKETYLV